MQQMSLIERKLIVIHMVGFRGVIPRRISTQVMKETTLK